MLEWGSDIFGAMVTSVFSGNRADHISEVSTVSGIDDEMINSEEEELMFMEQDRIDLRQRTMSLRERPQSQYLLEQAEDIEFRAISSDSALDSEEHDQRYVIRDREKNEWRMRTLSNPFPGSFEEQQTHTRPAKNTSIRNKRRVNQASPSFVSSDLGSSLRGERIFPSFASAPQQSMSSKFSGRSGEKMQPSFTASDRLASSASSFGKRGHCDDNGCDLVEKSSSVNFMISSPGDLLSTEQDILDSYTTIKSLPDDAILNSEEEEDLVQEHDRIQLRRRTLEVLEHPDRKEEHQEPDYTSEMNTEDEEEARSTQDRIKIRRRTIEALEHIQQEEDESLEKCEEDNESYLSDVENFKFGDQLSLSDLDSEEEASLMEECDRIKTRRKTLEKLELMDVHPDLAVDASNTYQQAGAINSAEEEADNIAQDRIHMRRKTLEILSEAGMKPAAHLSETEGGDPFTPPPEEKSQKCPLIAAPVTTSSFRSRKKKSSGRHNKVIKNDPQPPPEPSPTSPVSDRTFPLSPTEQADLHSDPTVPCIPALVNETDIQRSLFHEEPKGKKEPREDVKENDEVVEKPKAQSETVTSPLKTSSRGRVAKSSRSRPSGAASSSPPPPTRVSIVQTVSQYLDRNQQQQQQQVLDKMQINPLESVVTSQRHRILELEAEAEELHKNSLYINVDRNTKIPRNMNAAIDILIRQGEVIDKMQKELTSLRKAAAQSPRSLHRSQSPPLINRLVAVSPR
eukprot:TRINITY_DN12852_c0_g1_i1.p1 TRINITY_DN12852_c0_g1~~TRINITY_DN12852_c0_g1_i1.p1  ORF type:complete len:739 (+),score=138.38 TRINITY_DN12852_c0_g1_i1:163-2379(+)